MLVFEVNRAVSEAISVGNKPLILFALFVHLSLKLSELDVELKTEAACSCD